MRSGISRLHGVFIHSIIHKKTATTYSHALENQPAIEKIKKAEPKTSQNVVKITRNKPQNAHVKNNFEVGERKDRSLRSLRASSNNISQESMT
jgi:predicted secreted Zn-dependent protease